MLKEKKLKLNKAAAVHTLWFEEIIVILQKRMSFETNDRMLNFFEFDSVVTGEKKC